MTDPFSRRNMKVALLAAALFWLVVWAFVARRVGVDASAVGLYALVIVAYGVLGALSFGGPRLRLVAAVGALALAGAVAIPTFADTRLLAGGLAVAAGAAVDQS